MAFLDNSGDIILDAVLTDYGRELLARGDGSFNITQFALGDAEIDYALYRNANSALGAHPSGSAFYDIQIMQTPVFEAFTNNSISMHSKLISIPRTNILYLPEIRLAQASEGFEDFYSNTYIIAADENTQSSTSTNGLNMTTAGFFRGASGFNQNTPFAVDQGLDTTEISAETPLDSDLVETQYMVEIDNRFGSIVDDKGATASVSFIDDDNIATYYFTTDTDRRFFDDNFSSTTATPNAAVAGPRGTRFEFKIAASLELRTSTFLFTRLGSTISTLPKNTGGTVSNVKFLDTIVRVTGMTTGYSTNIPIRFVKSPA